MKNILFLFLIIPIGLLAQKPTRTIIYNGSDSVVVRIVTKKDTFYKISVIKVDYTGQKCKKTYHLKNLR